MIILDYIINNTDRHLNNFGFREESNGNINGMTKIFDNGNSLYCDLSIDDIKSILNNPISYKRFDKAKPFKSKHSKQIKVIKNLPNIKLDFDGKSIEEIVMDYSEYIGELRAKAIILLMTRRLKDVRELYSEK